jgi:hypothetical protein
MRFRMEASYEGMTPPSLTMARMLKYNILWLVFVHPTPIQIRQKIRHLRKDQH